MESFFGLTEYLQLDSITNILRENIGTFESTPLHQWSEKIEQYKATIHLMDSGSVKVAVEDYVKAYGYVDPLFAEDMFAPDSFLGLALHECFNKPNAK